MKQTGRGVSIFTALGAFMLPFVAHGGAAEIAATEGAGADALATVTGYRSISHHKSGLEVRLLEADGSASIAHDPIALIVVVTNNGTSDAEEHVWRLPRGVSRVRRLAESACGADIHVEVDGPGDGPIPRPVPRLLRLCFLSKEGRLMPELQFSDIAVKRAG